ncbi:type IX secretion system protein PorG [Chitinophaga sancti]|uniref:DUF6089 family protein n=2 Tax=Chitinophaga sancti TaxID=1004 RepID=A0ABZ0XI86_9BACT|nr:DUF6089 family protein [Chitinophaga sancti]WQG90331.1 DUF6089 family protein [Chitinophaga sancti]
MPNLIALRNHFMSVISRKVLVTLFVCLPFAVFGQYWQVGGALGISNYSGDLSQSKVDMRYTRYHIGLFVKRDLSPHVTLGAGFTYARIAGADSTNKNVDLRNRNLSFRSPILEGHIRLELNLFDIDDKGWTPYVFGGVGVFNFYPTTRDENGDVIRLRGLNTEGQGLKQYPDRKQYNLTSVSIPFGAGVKFLVRDNLVAGFEVGLRKTFTDYLDDVSKGYADYNTLLATYGAKTVKYAYRGPGTYPVEGFPRGSQKYDDWYVFTGFTLAYRFGGGKGPYNHWGKQKVSNCPKF